ncbi:hypothetical protein ACQ4PT_065806 [Festuca glaucescens]
MGALPCFGVAVSPAALDSFPWSTAITASGSSPPALQATKPVPAMSATPNEVLLRPGEGSNELPPPPPLLRDGPPPQRLFITKKPTTPLSRSPSTPCSAEQHQKLDNFVEDTLLQIDALNREQVQAPILTGLDSTTPPPRPPTAKRKTLAGITGFAGFPLQRSSPRLKAKRKAMPIAKLAEKVLCHRLGIVGEGEDVTEEAIAKFVQMFQGRLPDIAIAALRALF